MNNNDTIKIQGRELSGDDIKLIKSLIADNPSLNRTRLSKELCVMWDWRRPSGSLKDMACRTMLLKLERRGMLILPTSQNSSSNQHRNKCLVPVLHLRDEIHTELATLQDIELLDVRGSGYDEDLFNFLLDSYHYLGFKTTVGEYMKYLIVDKSRRPLGCILFGSSAWKAKERDAYIKWSIPQRERNLNFTTNNTRFLILPWVKVPHLASHVLAMALRRLNFDWQRRYTHPIFLVETFVDRSRFLGTCYRAANWIKVGQTVGRSRQDRYTKMSVPIKAIYVYPLVKNFSEELCR